MDFKDFKTPADRKRPHKGKDDVSGLIALALLALLVIAFNLS